MSAFYRDIFVQCPFYDKGAKHYIQCEGLKGTSAVKLLFFDDNTTSQKKKRDEYSLKYCECDYESCQLYQLLINKYDEITGEIKDERPS